MEFIKNNISIFWIGNGIINQISYSDGVTERKHRHFLDVVHTMMIYTHVLLYLWLDVLYTYHLLIKYHRFCTVKRLSHVFFSDNSMFPLSPHVFGCTYFCTRLVSWIAEVVSPVLLNVFVGYSHTHKGCKCYHPMSRKYFISTCIAFSSLFYFFTSSSFASLLPTYAFVGA